MNQPEGFDCPGCAWPEPASGKPKRIEFCESGAKALAEEATRARADRAFFATHPVADLRARSDYYLGEAGRLTEPMIKRAGASHFEPIGWDSALGTVADGLRGLAHADEAVFYTSGRASNEAAFVYQLLARCFGTNNLPDCSNMCHEPTSTALHDTIGIGKGSVLLEDFAEADVIVVAGQNPGSNHPRMLSTLEHAKRSGARILAINPLPEAGLLNFHDPQTVRGIIGGGSPLADLHLPIRNGGDQALFQLWNRWLVARGNDRPSAIDRAFIARHTAGFDALQAHLAGLDEAALLAATGLEADVVRAGFEMVAGAQRLIVCWAMGITQHRHAVDTIKEIVNLALLGGHIGRPGAGLCPVRGHSNVQGDRTMGIFERPEPRLLDALEAEFAVAMPRVDGHDTARSIEAFADRRARMFVSLGGNVARAAPDTTATEAALASADVTVHISTKLNRSHLVTDGKSIILPTHGRSDRDERGGRVQEVTVEDSMGLVHRSHGVLAPPSPDTRSEVAILCAVAMTLFAHDHPVPWAELASDNDRVRDRIARVIPGFDRFNERVQAPGGFALPHPPRDERRFDTPDGRAQFSTTAVAPSTLADDELMLQTLRSHDQYNTTIYGHDDRYRGLSGDRHVLLVHPDDLTRLGHVDGGPVDVVTALAGPERRLRGYRLVAYPVPRGTAAAYYPEANVLVPLDHRSPESGTPGSKSVPVRLEPCADDRGGDDARALQHERTLAGDR